MSALRALVPLLLALGLAWAGCNREAGTPGANAAAAGRRIVPTTTAAAELLSLLVGPADVLALPEQVDAYSAQDFRSGGWATLPRFPRYVAEPLLVLAPRLVVNHRWQPPETGEILRRSGIRVLTLESATTYAGVRAAILELGRELGREESAAASVAALDLRVQRLAERVRGRPALRALVYTNDGAGGWASGARTTADAVLALAGLANVAAQAGIEGHAELSFERLLTLDPDLIVTGAPTRDEKGSPTRSVIEGRDELAGLRARREGSIVAIPGALLSADSQHVVDAAERLVEELERLPGAPPR